MLGRFRVKLGEHRGLLRSRDTDRWRRCQCIAIHRGIGGGVVKRREWVKFLLRHRVELVVVTDSTSQGHAHKDRGHRFGSIDGVAYKDFFVDRSAFAGGDVAAIEAGRDLLIDRGIRQQVPGHLFDGELVQSSYWR